MSALIEFRRYSVSIRRDAAQQLPNGRILYDALLSRWGLQPYPGGVELRPESEVFADRSLLSLASLPGVLLHPEANFGTSFGDGSYPVRGVTGDVVTPHTDGIHTASTLMVWDEQWNAAIQATGDARIDELSLGFGIRSDATPGTAPVGTPGGDQHGFDYVAKQREITGDHCAGVPEGNAGTARVVTDMAQCTREALANMAAERMDAKPYFHDLGSWAVPARADRQDPEMTEATPDTTPEPTVRDTVVAFVSAMKADAKAVLDAWLMLDGETDDPDIKAAMGAMAGRPASVSDEQPDGDGEKADAARLDAFAHAEALFYARLALGPGHNGRADRLDAKSSRITTAEVQRRVVAKVDAKLLTRVDSFTDPAEQAIALRMQFGACKEHLDGKDERGDTLAAEIRATREDREETTSESMRKIADRLAANKVERETKTFGKTA